MGDLQATIEICIELGRFHNIDLFQRGFYQIRCSLKTGIKTMMAVEAEIRETPGVNSDQCVFPSYAHGSSVVSKTFQILYKSEVVNINDSFIYKLHLLVDSEKVKDAIDGAGIQLAVDLCFCDNEMGPGSAHNLTSACTQNVKLHVQSTTGLHHHVPLLFDYYHFAVIEMTVHASLTALGLPDVSCLRSVKGGGFSSKRGAVGQLYNNLFGGKFVMTQSSRYAYTVPDRQLQHAQSTHRKLCEILFLAHESLFEFFQTMMQFLPENQRLTLGQTDSTQRLHTLCSGIQSLTSCDEIFSKVCCDLKNLSSELYLMWSQCLEFFTLNKDILPELRRQHHQQRVAHLSDAFFVKDHSWSGLFTIQEPSLQCQGTLCQQVRSSSYYQNIPPVTLECPSLDGDTSSIPIIFEDRFRPSNDIITTEPQANGVMDLDDLDIVEFLSGEDQVGEEFEIIDDFLVPKTVNKSDCSKTPEVDSFYHENIFERPEELFTSLLEEHSSNTSVPANFEGYSENGLCVRELSSFTLDEESVMLEKSISQILDLETISPSVPSSSNSNIEVVDLSVKSSINDIQNSTLKNVEKEDTIQKRNCSSLSDVVISERMCNDIDFCENNSLDTKEVSEVTISSVFCSTFEKDIKQCSTGNDKESTSTSETSKLEHAHGTDSNCSSQVNTIPCLFNNCSGENGKCVSQSTLEPVASETVFESLTSAENLDLLPKDCKVGALSQPQDNSSQLNSNTNKSSETVAQNGSLHTSCCSKVKNCEKSASNSLRINSELTASSIDNQTQLQQRDSTVDSLTTSTERTSNPYTSSSVCHRKGNSVFYVDSETNKSFDDCNKIESGLVENHFLSPPQTGVASASTSSSARSSGSEYDDHVRQGCTKHSGIHSNSSKSKKKGSGKVPALVSCLPVKSANVSPPPSSGGYVLHNSDDMSTKYEKCKQQLQRLLDYQGHFYCDIGPVPRLLPYFSERRPMGSGTHLVVCVHGLDGNSGDLRLFRCYLETALPSGNLDFLMSEVNQPDTFVEFEAMTQRLVAEVKFYVEAFEKFFTKISFIGHSLGNIIIRSALCHPEMVPFLDRMHTFLSLSGPHLGMLYHTSSLVSTGLWFMQKWKKSGSLLQLSLNDHADPRQTFIYRLSQAKGFEYFKNVLLVSSLQDHYVPYHSARVEMSKAAVKDHSDYGLAYREMIRNILDPLQAKTEMNFIRYNVHHALPNTANNFIGRAAHIAMLDSELFIEKLLLVSALKYFT